IYTAITYRPFKGMQRMQSQASYVQPVAVSEAAVYPGWINRRIRWEPAAEKLLTADPKVLKTVYDLAAPAFEAPLPAYRQQLKHSLAPREAVFLLRCKMVGRIGERVVVEDAKGSRIETVDKRKDYSNVANLVRAAGELRNQPALLARLWVQPVTNTIV